MKFEFDEIGFKDEIELMNIQRKFEQQQLSNNQTQNSIGFNLDDLYNVIYKNKNKKT